MRSGRTLEVWEYGDPGGHPALFFHGLIGSHLQASYIADQARERGLRIIAPNRPGVGASGFVRRRRPVESVADVEDVAAALGLAEFSVIGISGGTPYALAALLRLGTRVRTATVISGMGPARLAGALRGMDPRRRFFLELGARAPHLAQQAFAREAIHFRADPERFLRRLVASWSHPDQVLFARRDVFELFLCDLHQVFTDGIGAEGLAQELALYRNYGFALRDLPRVRPVTLWQGLDDTIVPPAMAWSMAQSLPSCEAHFVPGGHFVALSVADQIIDRLAACAGDR
jgi:pimeloyl-ACP methyl ester carboxylesterase